MRRDWFVIVCSASNNNVREVRRMISEGVDINLVDSSGYTGLMWAMMNGNTEYYFTVTMLR